MFNNKISHLKDKLNEVSKLFGFGIDEFYNQLKLYDCHISGSFLLYILNGTEFNDIDIYHISSEEIEDVNIVFENIFSRHKLIKKQIYKRHQHEYFQFIDDIKSVTNYYNETFPIKFQIIELKSTTNMNKIIDTFDISICKNYFTAKNDELFISNEIDIIKKKFDFNNNNTNNKRKSILRKEKYESRGYVDKFDINNPFDDNDDNDDLLKTNCDLIIFLNEDDNEIIIKSTGEQLIDNKIIIKSIGEQSIDNENIIKLTSEQLIDGVNEINIGANKIKKTYIAYNANKILLSKKVCKIAILKKSYVVQYNKEFLLNFINVQDIKSFDDYISINKKFANNNNHLLTDEQFNILYKPLSQKKIIIVCKKNINILKRLYKILNFDTFKNIIDNFEYSSVNVYQFVNVIKYKLIEMKTPLYCYLGKQHKHYVEQQINNIDYNNIDELGYSVNNIISLLKIIIKKSSILYWDTNIQELYGLIISKNEDNILYYINEIDKQIFINYMKTIYNTKTSHLINECIKLYVNTNEFTDQEKLDIINNDIKIFKLFKNPSENICNSMIENNPDNIEYIDQTDERCIKAVMLDGLTLEYIKNQTDEIILLAIKQNKLAFKFADQEICMHLIRSLIDRNIILEKEIEEEKSKPFGYYMVEHLEELQKEGCVSNDYDINEMFKIMTEAKKIL